jgi:hypothetical protein
VPSLFNVETREGFRRIEFDPDVFRFRNVRILVDGKAVAEMPFPKNDAPFRQAHFELDGHRRVGISYLPKHPDPADGGFAGHDLYADGRSLSDGTPLSHASDRAVDPGRAYPNAFRVIDMIFYVGAVAGLQGFGIGIGRSIGEIGLDGLLIAVAAILVAFGVLVSLASKVWHRIKLDERSSVRKRTMMGAAVVTGAYALSFAVGLIALLAVGGAGAS